MRANFITRAVAQWVHQRVVLIDRDPDFVVAPTGEPYLLRWHLLKTPLGGIYVHLFLKSDDDRAPHDHPWPSVSLILDGSYVEQTGRRGVAYYRRYYAGDLLWRRAKFTHRIEVDEHRPVVTLFLVGPRLREWGFHWPQGWRHWREFVAAADPGQIGRGCA